MKRSPATTIAFVAIVVAVYACGTSSEDDERYPRPPPVGAKPAAGGGVCCPFHDVPCPPGYLGGWAANENDCYYLDGNDGSFERVTDEHGCEKWIDRGLRSDPTFFCCGCVREADASDASDASKEDAHDADESG